MGPYYDEATDYYFPGASLTIGDSFTKKGGVRLIMTLTASIFLVMATIY
jgi:hypothetical protein